MTDQYSPLDQLRHLFLHHVECRRITQVRLADTRDPSPVVDYTFARRHERVEQNVAVVVYQRDTGKHRLGAEVAEADHFAVDGDVVSGPGVSKRVERLREWKRPRTSRALEAGRESV